MQQLSGEKITMHMGKFQIDFLVCCLVKRSSSSAMVLAIVINQAIGEQTSQRSCDHNRHTLFDFIPRLLTRTTISNDNIRKRGRERERQKPKKLKNYLIFFV